MLDKQGWMSGSYRASESGSAGVNVLDTQGEMAQSLQAKAEWAVGEGG